jgi:hypothetical protein
LILIATTTTSCETTKSKIDKCFSEFKMAILDADGKKAVRLIDKETIEDYSQILGKAKSLDSLRLEKETEVNKYNVLKVRHLFSKEEILTMNGEKLFISVVDQSVSGNGNIKNYCLGNIKVENNNAKAERISNEGKTPFVHLFSKENGAWKIRMKVSSSPIDIVIKQGALDNGASENEYIFEMLRNMNGKDPSPQIWAPLN